MPTILYRGQAAFRADVIRGLARRTVDTLSAIGKIFASGICFQEKKILAATMIIPDHLSPRSDRRVLCYLLATR